MLSQRIIILFIFIPFAISSSFCIEPEIETTLVPVSCHGADDGKMLIRFKNIPTPCTLRLIKKASGDTLYQILSDDSEIQFEHLKAGAIDIELLANSEKVSGTLAQILEPEPLLTGKIKIDKPPVDETSCGGILSVTPKGGNPPYQYKWSENAGSSEESTITNVCKGIYRCEINDSKNCGPLYISIPLVKNTLNKTE